MKRSHRILVVDDDPAVADMVVSLLTRSGYAAQAATNGTAAIRAVDRFQPHLILLDLLMPDGDGATVARQLRERGHAVPLVAMSGLSDAARWIGDSHINVVSILAKPFDMFEMLATVRNAIDEEYAATNHSR